MAVLLIAGLSSSTDANHSFLPDAAAGAPVSAPAQTQGTKPKTSPAGLFSTDRVDH